MHFLACFSWLFEQQAAHQQRIDRYTEQLTGGIEQAALEAMSDLQPGRLEWSPGSAGQVGFAKNRRAKGGPVDHDLPVLIARTANGGIRAIYTSYACHCVTLSHNKISGDWAGYAQEWLQKNHPGTVALVSIGCGADQNPDTGVTGDKTAAASARTQRPSRARRKRCRAALPPAHDARAAAGCTAAAVTSGRGHSQQGSETALLPATTKKKR